MATLRFKSAIFRDLTLLLASLVSDLRRFVHFQKEWITTNHSTKQRTPAVWVISGEF